MRRGVFVGIEVGGPLTGGDGILQGLFPLRGLPVVEGEQRQLLSRQRGSERLDGLGHSIVKDAALLLQQALVNNILSERVLEHVLELGDKVLGENELLPLQNLQVIVQITLGEDNRVEQPIGENPSDDRCDLQNGSSPSGKLVDTGQQD